MGAAKFKAALDKKFSDKAKALQLQRDAYTPEDATKWHVSKKLRGLGVNQRYIDYLTSPEWFQRRRLILKQRGERCESCGSKSRIEIHHLTYAAIGHELDEHLLVLCRDCHAKRHSEKRTAESQVTAAAISAGRASRFARERGSVIPTPPQEPTAVNNANGERTRIACSESRALA